MNTEGAKKPRSESRKKGLMAGFRVTAKELADLKQLAEHKGLSVAAYTRSRTLEAPTTRGRRRPLVEEAVLSKLVAQLGRMGGLLNQIARGIHQGELVTQGEIQAALGEHRQILAAVLAALGRPPQ